MKIKDHLFEDDSLILKNEEYIFYALMKNYLFN